MCEYDEIPLNKCPTKFYEIELRGWSPITFKMNDDNLTLLLAMGSFIASRFVGLYGETHQLSFQFMFKLDGIAIVKIATLEKEIQNV